MILRPTLNFAKKLWRWIWMLPMIPIALLAVLIALIGNGRSETLNLLSSKEFWKDYISGR